MSDALAPSSSTASGCATDNGTVEAAASSGVPPLSRRKIFAFSLGHVLNDLCASCWFTYLLVLMHTVLGLASWKAAVIMLSGQFADAIATPLVGIFSDKAKGITCGSFYFGRRHLWYSIGTIVVIVNFFFLFGRCVLCDLISVAEDDSESQVIVVYYSLAAAFFNFGWAAVQVSHMSLVPEMTEDESVRVVLNSVRYTATVVSNLFVFLVLGLLIHVFKIEEIWQFHTLAFISIGVGLLTSIGFIAGTEERRPRAEQIEYDEQMAAKRLSNRLNDDYASLEDDSISSSVPMRKAKSPSFVRVEPVAPKPSKKPAPGATLATAGDSHKYNSLDDDDVTVPDSSIEKTESPDPYSLETTLDRRLTALPVKFISWRCWLNQPEYWVAAFIYMCTRIVVNVSQVCLPFFVLDVLELSNIFITIIPCTVYISSMIAAGFMQRAHKKYGYKVTFCVGSLLVISGCVGMFFLPTTSPGVWFVFPCSIALGLGNGTVMVCCGALTAELIGSRTNHAAFVFGSFSFGDKFMTGAVLFVIQSFNHDGSTYMRMATTIPTIVGAVAGAIAIVWGVDLPKWRYKHSLPCAGSPEALAAAEAALFDADADAYDVDRSRSNSVQGQSQAPQGKGAHSKPSSVTTASTHLVAPEGDFGDSSIASAGMLDDHSRYAHEPMPRSLVQSLSMLNAGPGETALI